MAVTERDHLRPTVRDGQYGRRFLIFCREAIGRVQPTSGRYGALLLAPSCSGVPAACDVAGEANRSVADRIALQERAGVGGERRLKPSERESSDAPPFLRSYCRG